jgi:hypothetical protein
MIFLIFRKLNQQIVFYFLILITGNGCKYSYNENRFYKDFNLYRLKGIDKIDDELVEELDKQRQSYLELIYRANEVDEIIIHNSSLEQRNIILHIFRKGFVTVYTTSYHILTPEENFINHYFVFNKKEARQYIFSDGTTAGGALVCRQSVITNSNCSHGLKMINKSDTANVVSRLLDGEWLPIQHTYPAVNCSDRVDDKFTIIKWLVFDDILPESKVF